MVLDSVSKQFRLVKVRWPEPKQHEFCYIFLSCSGDGLTKTLLPAPGDLRVCKFN